MLHHPDSSVWHGHTLLAHVVLSSQLSGETKLACICVILCRFDQATIASSTALGDCLFSDFPTRPLNRVGLSARKP